MSKKKVFVIITIILHVCFEKEKAKQRNNNRDSHSTHLTILCSEYS